jgi:hypothetical protein
MPTPNIPEAIRGNDIGDVCDQLWAGISGSRESSPSVSTKGFDPGRNKNNREAGDANNAPASNHDDR